MDESDINVDNVSTQIDEQKISNDPHSIEPKVAQPCQTEQKSSEIASFPVNEYNPSETTPLQHDPEHRISESNQRLNELQGRSNEDQPEEEEKKNSKVVTLTKDEYEVPQITLINASADRLAIGNIHIKYPFQYLLSYIWISVFLLQYLKFSFYFPFYRTFNRSCQSRCLQ